MKAYLFLALSVACSSLFYIHTAAKPIVSIITSLYDADEFIEPFLKDITRQTIFDQCELIIINANSPGNEEPIIKKYMQQYPNIVYLKLDVDPGVYGVWNKAVILARGQFITNANVDDRLSPICYEQHLKTLREHPEVDLVYSDFYETRYPNETFERNHAYGRCRHPEYSPEIMKKYNLPHCNPMWRRTLHQKYGFFDTTYKNAGDWEMWLRAVEGGSQFKKVEGVYCLYYRNPKGLSSNKEREKECYAEIRKVRQQYCTT